jgi:hypothetical protein
MNEHDEFLRDRMRPSQPGAAAARRPGPQSNGPQTAPPGGFFPVPPRPVPQRQPAAPAAPLRQWAHPPAAVHPQAPAAQRASGVSPLPGAWADGAVTPVRTRPSLRADRGWRRIVELITFGLVRPGPSAAQREEAQFEAAIRTVLNGNHKVGVLGKGGVGKTSVAVCVGSILAERRKWDRIVAIDADTAFGQQNRSEVERLVLGVDGRQEPAIVHRCDGARRPEFRRIARARR